MTKNGPEHEATHTSISTCLKSFDSLKFPEKITCARTIFDGTVVVTVSSRNNLLVYDVLDSSKFSKKIECTYRAMSICSLILGKTFEDLRVFLGSVEGDLIEWHPFQKSEVYHRKGHKGMIFSISCDSSHLFSISDDRTLRMWNLKEFQSHQICTAYGHTARPFAICVNENQKNIYTGGIDQAVFIWNYSDKEISLIRKIFLSIGVIRKIVLVEKTALVVESLEGEIILVDDLTEKQTEIGQNIISFAWLNNDRIVTLNNKQVLRIYNINAMDEIICEATPVRHLNSGKNSVVCWNQNIIHLINDENVMRLEMSSNIINAITNDQYLIAKLLDGFLRVYHVKDNSNVHFFKKFKLIKPSILPSVFEVTELMNTKIAIIGTTHGNLLSCVLTREGCDSAETVLNRKQSKELFGDKEITCVEFLEDSSCFMVLSKTGYWTTFKLFLKNDRSVSVIMLNCRTFSTSSRLKWPCKFYKIDEKIYIVGFHGTSLVIYDTMKGPIYETYCGGGHREWQVNKSTDSSNVVNFDFVQNSTLYRQRINLKYIQHLVQASNSSAIVSAAGSPNFLSTVSLDGFLTILSSFKPNSYNYKIEKKIFASENLLCTDIFETPEEIYVATGGGKSKLSIWKFSKTRLETNNFLVRHISRSDEGRIVAVKICKLNSKLVFVASFSSGRIEVFDLINNELHSISSTFLDDYLGIGAKLAIVEYTEKIELFVGTSGSFILSFELASIFNNHSSFEIKLADRSGVTALSVNSEESLIVGTDLGGVYIVKKSGKVDKVHHHFSTVVGVKKSSKGNIHSLSLDCVVLTTENEKSITTSQSTSLNMPASLTQTGECLIVAGDRLQSLVV